MRVRGHRLNAGQTEMHAFYVGVAAELGPVFRDALDIENSFFLELVARVEQTLLTLGVRRGDGPVESREKDNPQTVHRFGK